MELKFSRDAHRVRLSATRLTGAFEPHWSLRLTHDQPSRSMLGPIFVTANIPTAQYSRTTPDPEQCYQGPSTRSSPLPAVLIDDFEV